jgi:Fe-S oxidoreductase
MNPGFEYLLWVGCAAAFDPRAQKVARATAQLLKEAKVNFAVLGVKENCTGDPARRIGDEFLYQQLAQTNHRDAYAPQGEEDRDTVPTLLQHAQE